MNRLGRGQIRYCPGQERRVRRVPFRPAGTDEVRGLPLAPAGSAVTKLIQRVGSSIAGAGDHAANLGAPTTADALPLRLHKVVENRPAN